MFTQLLLPSSSRCILVVMLLGSCGSLFAQSIINTIAGNGTRGFSGDGGPATAAQVSPNRLAVDRSGNVYFSDATFRIRKVTSAGLVQTIGGTGTRGHSGDGGSALSAMLGSVSDIGVDSLGNVYVCQSNPISAIRKIDTSGTITTLNPGGFGCLDSMRIDSTNNVWMYGVTCQGSAACYVKISPQGTVTMFHGFNSTDPSSDWGYDFAVDPDGRLHTRWHYMIFRREYTPSFTPVPLAGRDGTRDGIVGGPGFSGDGGPATEAHIACLGITFDSNRNLYFIQNGYWAPPNGGYRIRRVSSSGLIQTIAGNGQRGFSGDGGLATAAQIDPGDESFTSPTGMATDPFGNVYFIDGGSRIRRIGPPIELVDPLEPALLLSAVRTSDFNTMSRGGRSVRGVAADGTARLLVRIPTKAAGDAYKITLLRDSLDGTGTVQDVGGLSTTGPTPSWGSSVDVIARNTTSGPMAFAVYLAPEDFVTKRGDFFASRDRSLSLLIEGQSLGSVPFQVSLKVIRPPLLMIPGLGIDIQTFDNLDIVKSPPPGLVVSALPYEGYGLGLKRQSVSAYAQAKVRIKAFREANTVAAAQADFVGYSAGGIILRRIQGFPSGDDTYGLGIVHKAITLGAPHEGSEAVDFALKNGCEKTVAGVRGLDTLEMSSVNIRTLLSDSKLPDFAFAGVIGAVQRLEIESSYEYWALFVSGCAPSSLDSIFGGTTEFGGTTDHDSLVSERSARAGSAVAGHTFPFRSHSLSVGNGPDLVGSERDTKTNKVFAKDGTISLKLLEVLDTHKSDLRRPY